MHAVSIAHRSTASFFTNMDLMETFSERMSPVAPSHVEGRSSTLNSSIALKPFTQDPLREYLPTLY